MPGGAADQIWPEAFHLFGRVKEIEDIGAAVAPYNWEAGISHIDQLVWAHMHEWRFDKTGEPSRRTGYNIPDDVEDRICTPYERAVAMANAELDKHQ
jgi:hypothetical protein